MSSREHSRTLIVTRKTDAAPGLRRVIISLAAKYRLSPFMETECSRKAVAFCPSVRIVLRSLEVQQFT